MNIFYWITLAVILFATYGAASLSRNDWKQKNVCPKIVGIPACYIVFICFLAASISHIINTPLSNQLFFVFVGIPGIIALIGSIIELTGKTICPKTASKTPMCFISLGLCVTLLVLKYFSL